jgi:hypothetical protein
MEFSSTKGAKKRHLVCSFSYHIERITQVAIHDVGKPLRSRAASEGKHRLSRAATLTKRVRIEVG